VKNYIVLVLGCSFVCTQAMQPLDVLIQDKNGDTFKNNNGGKETINIGPNTTWYDVQDQLRQKMGPGNLLMSNNSKVKVGEKGGPVFIKRDVGNVKASLSKYAGNLQIFFELAQ